MSEAKNKDAKLVVDGQEVKQNDLSDRSKKILGFVARLDQEIRDIRFQLDRATLARKQAMQDLNLDIESDKDSKQVAN
jgi:hypothetical protein